MNPQKANRNSRCKDTKMQTEDVKANLKKSINEIIMKIIMTYTYKTKNTCSTQIQFDKDENGIITNVVFTNGCNGNLKAIAKLVEGMKAEEIAAKLMGNTCGHRPTSCADQLAKAVMSV